MVHSIDTSIYLSYIKNNGDGLYLLIHKIQYHNRIGVELKEWVSPYTGLQQSIAPLAVLVAVDWASK